MSVQWEIVLMSFFLFSTAQAGGYCGPNKMYACVPTLFCKDGRSTQRNPAAYFNRQCFSFETCCDVNRVIYGMRYTGGEFEPGPYEQTSEPFNNAGGKTSGTNSQQSTGNTGGNSPTLKKKGGVSSITNIQNTNNGEGKTFTTNSQMPSYTMNSQPSNNAGGKTNTANNQAPSDSDGKTFTHSTNFHAHNYLNNNSGKTNLGNPPTANTKNTNSPTYHHYQNVNYNPSGNSGSDAGVYRQS